MMRRLVSCVLAVSLGVGGCSASTNQPGKGGQQVVSDIGSGTGDRPSDSSATAPVVMMLGDSYTAGIATVPPEATYAAETARKLDWQIIISGYRGTGFVAPGRVGKTFTMLYEEELAWRPAPDMVVVAGGHNDWPYGPGLVTLAARGLLTKIRLRWPDTRLVLIGPMWGGEPGRAVLHTANALKGVAAELQIPFIDPLRERWITGAIHRGSGNARKYIHRDGVHPNAAGNRYFADRFVADLRRLGLDRPRLSTQR